MFAEFLNKKFFQSCSARTGFTPIHDAFVALRVVNNLLYQVFVCQVQVHCNRPETQHFDECYKHKQSESFLSQPEHTIWVSRQRTSRTQYLHLGVFLLRQFMILASYKDFCKLQSFCLCNPLLTLTYSFFSGTYLLKFSSS